MLSLCEKKILAKANTIYRSDRLATHSPSLTYVPATSGSLSGGRHLRCKATTKYNPQNVPDPQVLPNLSFGPEDAVRAQLDALKRNDEPWPNHGIQTAYEFGEDIGGMERSRYFGYSKDLYHFDHFLGQFQNAFPELVDFSSYTIEKIEQRPDGAFAVAVNVSKCDKIASFIFVLFKKDIGRKKGSWMTRTLIRNAAT